ncbi:chalcone isomerase family protein [Oceanispirochaeta sp.]|jgi:hypothetical protein|uniref:chalcone isomerase family protein n=1 Tax=Oceanispirochaeta sp. TaxID=2035350 RepID=UPI0026373FC3|nr:chalcone isomerase family protein [Oceanispirochaeta sp.]MDA3955392.1 chalcone isomerase family protein [Oceanispirochaeta sp.]
MKKIITLLLFSLTLPVFSAPVLSGVKLMDQVSYNGKNYELSGAGIRKKLFLKLYVGSLYTEKAISSESEVLSGSVASVIQLDIISKLITSELMAETIEEGFAKAMGGDTSSLQGKINDFQAVFKDEIVKGDQFTFISLPGMGVVAYKGKKELITIKDDRFRKVLFTIWLGDDPADANLKKGMLNQ